MVPNCITMISLRFAVNLLVAACMAAPFALCSAPDSSQEIPSTRVPVLLELFTSEGCSSCPPADQLLMALDQKQPVSGVDLIVLSEHVDYWNRLGWRDPFSSAVISQRQEEYASKLGIPEIYTPQIVIDGSRQALGSSWPAVKKAVVASLQQSKVPVNLSARKDDARTQVQVSIAPSAAVSARGDIYLVLAADHTQSKVLRGENSGQELEHVAVAYSFRKIGKLAAGQPFSKELDVTPDANMGSSPTRVIVFVQNSDKHIVGLAEAKE